MFVLPWTCNSFQVGLRDRPNDINPWSLFTGVVHLAIDTETQLLELGELIGDAQDNLFVLYDLGLSTVCSGTRNPGSSIVLGIDQNDMVVVQCGAQTIRARQLKHVCMTLDFQTFKQWDFNPGYILFRDRPNINPGSLLITMATVLTLLNQNATKCVVAVVLHYIDFDDQFKFSEQHS